MRELDELLDRALETLSSRRLAGEVYVEDLSVFSVSVSGGAIESLESQESRGAGVRVFEGERVGFAYTSDLTPTGLAEAAGLARGLASKADPDVDNALPEADESPTPEPEVHDPAVARIDVQEKIRAARRIEEAARAADPRVKAARRSRYTDVVGRTGVAGTGGMRRAWPFTRIYGSIEVNAEEKGEQQSGWASDFAIRAGGLDPAAIGREAARRALAKLGARRAPTRRTNLVLDPVVASSLVEALSPSLHADNTLKGKSLLASKLGASIGSPKVTLLDDGRAAGGDHSAPYDGEGVATRCTMLIEGGVLKGFLHSSYTSLRMAAAPTGNAARASFKSPPRIAPSNLFLQPTGASRESLLAEAGDGLYITEVMGLHTIDPVSGDFSLGACGLALSGGQPGAPVDRIAVAGNVLGLLRSIGGVAVDLRFMPGGGAGSTTLLLDISVSGS
ncbi:MAG TPA: TldD/PmbA family protein [Candidatus Polarisedimenticolia bacterium]|nr:TldD/PmbA family protein [Candidatus Polarisedimenticolia bacterium]